MAFGNESHSASKEEFYCSLLILLSSRVDLLEGLRQLTVLNLCCQTIIHGSGQLDWEQMFVKRKVCMDHREEFLGST